MRAFDHDLRNMTVEELCQSAQWRQSGDCPQESTARRCTHPGWRRRCARACGLCDDYQASINCSQLAVAISVRRNDFDGRDALRAFFSPRWCMHFFVGLAQPALLGGASKPEAGCEAAQLRYVGPDAPLPESPRVARELRAEAAQFGDLHMVNHIDTYFNLSAKLLGEIVWAHELKARWVLLMDMDDAFRQSRTSFASRVTELTVKLESHSDLPLLIGNYMDCLNTANHVCNRVPRALQTINLPGPYAKMPPVPHGGDSMALNWPAIELVVAARQRCYYSYSDHAVGLWAQQQGVVPHSWSWRSLGQQYCNKEHLSSNYVPVSNVSWRCRPAKGHSLEEEPTHVFTPSNCFCDPQRPVRGALAQVSLVPFEAADPGVLVRVSTRAAPILSEVDEHGLSQRRAPWFLRAAKTGSTSLIDMLSEARDSSPACSGLQFTLKHTELTPPRGSEPAVVLREPAERFVSAYYFALSELVEHDDNAVIEAAEQQMSAVYRYCGRVYRSQPSRSRLERLAAAGSPLAFARALLANESERNMWLGAPTLRTALSSCSPKTPCGGLCGFVPQDVYTSHVQAPMIACLPCLQTDAQRVLDATIPGCKLNVRQESGSSWQALPLLRGSQSAAQDAELRGLVAKLFPRDVQMWNSTCSAHQCDAPPLA